MSLIKELAYYVAVGTAFFVVGGIAVSLLTGTAEIVPTGKTTPSGMYDDPYND